jgi:hypothetical protein
MVDDVSEERKLSDRDFVAGLRSTVKRYLEAVDHWESAYQKYYRMPGFASRVGDDLEREQRAYDERRRELEAMVPRARRLCLKHQMQDPFSGLLRVSLGRYSPQERLDSVIGRNERSVVSKCLVELHDACQEWPEESREPDEDRTKGSLLRRIVGYFY